MSPEKLTGPKKAKLAIDDFEAWLADRCRERREKEEILAEYQYQTGHAIRKLNEWMDAIRSNGKIKFVRDFGKDYILWIDGTENKEKLQPQAKISRKLQDFIEKQRTREKMLAGPCLHGCTVPFQTGDEDCRRCSVFRNLKNKDFLELEEEE